MAEPFPSQFWPAVTQTWNPAIGELGDDWGLPVGQVLTAPKAGTIVAEEDKGKTNWGYRIFEQFPNGWKFAIGHVSQFLVPVGTHVAAGQPIAYSGGAVNDPHGGHTTGPHIEPQLIDPSGLYHDPYQWLAGIFKSGGNSIPAMPGGTGVKGPLPTFSTGVGGVPSNIGNSIAAPGATGLAGNLLQPNLDLNPLDIPKGIADHILAPITASIRGAFTTGEHFLIANVVGLAVAAVIIVLVLGDSKGAGPSIVNNMPGAPTPGPAPSNPPARTPAPAPRPVIVPVA